VPTDIIARNDGARGGAILGDVPHEPTSAPAAPAPGPSWLLLAGGGLVGLAALAAIGVVVLRGGARRR
jgi:hypothetical protein